MSREKSRLGYPNSTKPYVFISTYHRFDFFTVAFGGQWTGCQILKIIYVIGTLSQHRHTQAVVCGISVIDLNNLIALTGELVVLSY